MKKLSLLLIFAITLVSCEKQEKVKNNIVYSEIHEYILTFEEGDLGEIKMEHYSKCPCHGRFGTKHKESEGVSGVKSIESPKGMYGITCHP